MVCLGWFGVTRMDTMAQWLWAKGHFGDTGMHVPVFFSVSRFRWSPSCHATFPDGCLLRKVKSSETKRLLRFLNQSGRDTTNKNRDIYVQEAGVSRNIKS